MNESMRPPPPSAAWWASAASIDGEFMYEQQHPHHQVIMGQVENAKNHLAYYDDNISSVADGHQQAHHYQHQELPCMTNQHQSSVQQSYAPSSVGTEMLYSPLSYGVDDGMTPPAMDYGQFDGIPTYPPCHGPRPWNFAYCYGYYGEPACPMINMVDMEDFM